MNHLMRWLLVVALLVLGPSPAFASRYRGADWGILFVFYTLPFTLIPIGLSLLLAAFKAFRRPAVYFAFVLAAVLVASFFTLLVLRAPGGFSSSAIALAEIFIVLAITLLAPWLQHRRNPHLPNTSATRSTGDEM